MIVQQLSIKGVVILSILGALVLSGCTTEIDPAIRKAPTFQVGYNDGCTTVNQRVAGFKETVRRNDSLFEQDEAYKAGWKEGYSTCGGSTTRETEIFGGEEGWYTNGPL